MKKEICLTAVCLFLAILVTGCGGSGSSDSNSLQAQLNDNPDDKLSNEKETAPLKGEGWYKGDLHAHSTYSDGDVSVEDVVRIAEEKGLDYFVITEHMHDETDNVTKSWNDFGYSSSKMTLLYGAEWTTSKGHANIFSNMRYDWKPLYAYDKLNMAKETIELAHSYRTEDQEVLFSINHPMNSWEYSYEESNQADCMEIWNSVVTVPAMTGFIDGYLKKGMRITAVGGSDSHDHMAEYKEIKDLAANVHNIGWPTTWVYAKTNSAFDILKGIRAGNTAISISPEGPFIEFKADTDNDGYYELMTGDTIPDAAFGKDVKFKVFVSRAETGGKPYFTRLTVTKNGMPLKDTFAINDIYVYEFTDKPDDGDFYRVKLSNLIMPVGFTGPIYTW